MIKVMMHGCNGAMGQVISGIIEESESAVMAAGIDFKDDGHNPYLKIWKTAMWMSM